ncbi:erythromycin esterase family protein [Streptomyces sp. NPDC020996]|uniref:erythromycin esterase family protein n=1 Tax=Streptomyces sp. NPDC020996 TaxID=3154791 RepID=UPI0033FE2936
MPARGTNEYILDLVPHPDHLLDLRTVRQPAREWLTEARPTREIGTEWPGAPAVTWLLRSSDLLIHFHYMTPRGSCPSRVRGR